MAGREDCNWKNKPSQTVLILNIIKPQAKPRSPIKSAHMSIYLKLNL